jgi:hypothetical protein
MAAPGVVLLRGETWHRDTAAQLARAALPVCGF